MSADSSPNCSEVSARARAAGIVQPAGKQSRQESAERQAERMYRADSASQSLGIRIRQVQPGRATATMTVTATMANGHGNCHGGYLFLLADTVFAFACNTYGDPAVAAGADVTFLAPVAVGDELVADAVERVRRGRSGLYDVTVRRASEVVLEFRGRSRSLSRTARSASGDRP